MVLSYTTTPEQDSVLGEFLVALKRPDGQPTGTTAQQYFTTRTAHWVNALVAEVKERSQQATVQYGKEMTTVYQRATPTERAMLDRLRQKYVSPVTR